MIGSCQSNGSCPSPESNTPPQEAGVKTWHCGTIAYTKAGLFVLFAFLLWGDFCFTLMEAVVPSIIPLKLKAMGASNVLMGALMTSLPAVLGTFMNPFISFKSDRCRSKWGRRIPFILFTLPPLCVCLVGVGLGENIGAFLATHLGVLAAFSPMAVTLAVVGTFYVLFQFFNQFVGAVFCGLFNDVVPPSLLGRFLGSMRIVGSAASFCYNYFVFQHAESHMREIFLLAAVVYLVGVGAMCLFVKEKEHPPISEDEKLAARGLTAIKTYFRESFCHKFYWTKFGLSMCTTLSGACSGFMVFFYKEMGMTLGDIGKAHALLALVPIGTAYFASIFVDRWHPIRITLYGMVLGLAVPVSNAVWLFITLPTSAFFWLHVLGGGAIMLVSSSIGAAASLPFDMRLHPSSRFTQFCSAQSLLRSFVNVVSGVVVGLFFDTLMRIFPGSDYAYRFWIVWNIAWLIPATFLICSLYRQWHALGGDRAFHPPAPWNESGFEDQPQTPVVGPQSKWLRIAMRLTHALVLGSVLYLIPLSYYLWIKGWTFDLEWHLFAVIPGAIALYLWWLAVERSLKQDIERCQAGETPRNGIPHHGMFVFKSACMLVLLVIWIGKTIAAVHGGQEGGVMVLGFGNLFTNSIYIAAILLLRRIERNHPLMLDYDGRNEADAVDEKAVAPVV